MLLLDYFPVGYSELSRLIDRYSSMADLMSEALTHASTLHSNLFIRPFQIKGIYDLQKRQYPLWVGSQLPNSGLIRPGRCDGLGLGGVSLKYHMIAVMIKSATTKSWIEIIVYLIFDEIFISRNGNVTHTVQSLISYLA